jgi:hypothetical protein
MVEETMGTPSMSLTITGISIKKGEENLISSPLLNKDGLGGIRTPDTVVRSHVL